MYSGAAHSNSANAVTQLSKSNFRCRTMQISPSTLLCPEAARQITYVTQHVHHHVNQNNVQLMMPTKICKLRLPVPQLQIPHSTMSTAPDATSTGQAEMISQSCLLLTAEMTLSHLRAAAPDRSMSGLNLHQAMQHLSPSSPPLHSEKQQQPHHQPCRINVPQNSTRRSCKLPACMAHAPPAWTPSAPQVLKLVHQTWHCLVPPQAQAALAPGSHLLLCRRHVQPAPRHVPELLLPLSGAHPSPTQGLAPARRHMPHIHDSIGSLKCSRVFSGVLVMSLQMR